MKPQGRMANHNPILDKRQSVIHEDSPLARFSLVAIGKWIIYKPDMAKWNVVQ
jgi:hypothetical protein